MASSEHVLEENEVSIRDENGTLTTAVKEIAEKLEEMKGKMSTMKSTVELRERLIVRHSFRILENR